MAGDPDDDYDFSDIDDADLVAVVDKAEKSFAGTQAQGQAPSRQPSAAPARPSTRVSSVAPPKKPLQTRPVAVPKKPVYDDDFPNVIPDANGSYKKWVDPKDAERARMTEELEQVSVCRLVERGRATS